MGSENLNENVDALASLAVRAERDVGPHQRRIEHFTGLLGRPGAFYLISALAGAWCGVNLLAPTLGVRAPDPAPFVWMQGVVGLCALLMTTIILTTQNRQTRHSAQLAQLELQVNLLSEQKIAKLIALVEELRRDIPTVRNRVDAVAEVMKEPVDPHAVMSALEHTTTSMDSSEEDEHTPGSSDPPH